MMSKVTSGPSSVYPETNMFITIKYNEVNMPLVAPEGAAAYAVTGSPADGKSAERLVVIFALLTTADRSGATVLTRVRATHSKLEWFAVSSTPAQQRKPRVASKDAFAAYEFVKGDTGVFCPVSEELAVLLGTVAMTDMGSIKVPAGADVLAASFMGPFKPK